MLTNIEARLTITNTIVTFTGMNKINNTKMMISLIIKSTLDWLV